MQIAPSIRLYLLPRQEKILSMARVSQDLCFRPIVFPSVPPCAVQCRHPQDLTHALVLLCLRFLRPASSELTRESQP